MVPAAERMITDMVPMLPVSLQQLITVKALSELPLILISWQSRPVMLQDTSCRVTLPRPSYMLITMVLMSLTCHSVVLLQP